MFHIAFITQICYYTFYSIQYLCLMCSSNNLFNLLNRYLNNHLNSTLTVCWQGKPCQHLERKLWNFMRPKCHPIFFDSNINSARVVRLNIYQAFLLCAMKFHCYVSSMSFHCHLSATFYANMIERSLRFGSNKMALLFILSLSF